MLFPYKYRIVHNAKDKEGFNEEKSCSRDVDICNVWNVTK